LNAKEKLLSIIGGVGFLCLGIWFETVKYWKETSLLLFSLVFVIAVVATLFSYHWKPAKFKLEK